jgi:hypothetical protein
MTDIRSAISGITETISSLARRVRRLEAMDSGAVSVGTGADLLVAQAVVGASYVIVNAVPKGVVANMGWVAIDPYTVECEVRKVTGIAGNVLTLAPLSYAHAASDRVIWLDDAVATVELFGAIADGITGTNNTLAIQRALDAHKAGHVRKILLRDVYNIGTGTLKWQNVHDTYALNIEGGSKDTCGVYSNGSPLVLDLIGSSVVTLKNFSILGVADVGILLARATAAIGYGNNVTMEGVAVDGVFTKACIYSINSEINNFIDCMFENQSHTVGSHVFYMSTENGLSVTSDGGTIAQSTDGATNSVVNILGCDINHYEDGVCLGLYGDMAVINIENNYFYAAAGKDINIDKTTVLTTTNGPINIFKNSFEGGNGVYKIYINDINVYYLNIEKNYFVSNATKLDIYQATVGRNINVSKFANNRHNQSPALSFNILYKSEVQGSAAEIRTSASGVRWVDCLPTLAGGASETKSMRFGRIVVGDDYAQTIDMYDMTNITRAKTATAQSFASGVEEIVDFDTIDFDFLAQITTGAAWKFTAARTGHYRVDVVVTLASSAGWVDGEAARLQLYKDGVAYAILDRKDNQGTTGLVTVGGSTVVQLDATHYIDVQLYQESGGAIALQASALYNHISITKMV